jgi:hypothetical protein
MPEPAWDAPFPYGFPAAIESAGTVAAPLLAGFTFALIGLIVTAADTLRYPGIALSLLVTSSISAIAAVQCGFWSRQFAITKEDIRVWRQDYPPERQLALQRLHRRGYEIWTARFTGTYRAAILLLLAGVAMTLVPTGPIGLAHCLAIGIAGLGFVGESLWVAAGLMLGAFPTATYEGEPDEPDGPVFWYQHAPWLLRPARWLVPLPRVPRQPPASG